MWVVALCSDDSQEHIYSVSGVKKQLVLDGIE